MTEVRERQSRLEKAAGLLLLAAAAAALFAANSGFSEAYGHLLHLELGLDLPRMGPLTVHAFVSEALMALFFLLVGMEVKREWYEGRLSDRQARRLPILAAVGGMAVPALVYVAVIGFDPSLLHGWAIPTATDIAFAIAVLAILGTHAPPSIKVFLVSIAVVDDIGAVAIIAIAYTSQIDTLALGAACAVVIGMALMNMMGVRRIWPYLAGFALLWILVLASGIHATIAGVAAALTVPLGPGESRSTLEHLEHKLHPWAMFGIAPLFAFASAGVDLSGVGMALFEPLPLAVMLGLLIGKQAGVFAAVRIGAAMGVCCRPGGASWPQVYGASVLCGIGFTMSLFIGGIAFDSPAQVDAAKIGTLAGSLLSAIIGWAVLRASSPVPWLPTDVAAASRLFGGRPRPAPVKDDCGPPFDL
jgi:Na+:H+ antiporter, NhaA family